MKVLLLAKMDNHDRIVEKFADKFMSQGFEIHVLNVVPIPSEIPLKMNGEVIDVCTEYNLTKYYDKQKAHNAQLANFFSVISTENKASLIGDPLHIVKHYVKEKGIELVISGGHLTKHAEDLFSTTFSNQLMQQLSVPYLSIKGEKDEPRLQTIAIVREFVDPAKRNLDLIQKLQEKFNSRLLLVKINTPNSHTEETELRSKMEQFAELNGLKNVEFLTVEAADKETAIKSLIESHHVDLLTLGHIHRNGMSYFLRGDLRSDLLNHINIPIYMY
jgi:nucleotide-binding universal stress UspA family protein